MCLLKELSLLGPHMSFKRVESPWSPHVFKRVESPWSPHVFKGPQFPQLPERPSAPQVCLSGLSEVSTRKRKPLSAAELELRRQKSQESSAKRAKLQEDRKRKLEEQKQTKKYGCQQVQEHLLFSIYGAVRNTFNYNLNTFSIYSDYLVV